jgi:hypothetical protein
MNSIAQPIVEAAQACAACPPCPECPPLVPVLALAVAVGAALLLAVLWRKP